MREGEREVWGGDQHPECNYYAATPIEMLCQCLSIVWARVRLPLTATTVLMTKSLWGSEDNDAVEPPQSARLMLPFQPPGSAAECARLPVQREVAQGQGARPYKNAGEGLLPNIDYTGSVPPQCSL